MNESEKRSISKMLRIFCKGNHHHKVGLCEECTELEAYAHLRLEKCPFAETKPNCEDCSIHCYRSAMRTKVCNVMRYSGPRTLIYAPTVSINHLIRKISKRKPVRK